MPRKKKRKMARHAIRPRITSSQGPTYDTLMIVTILLLLFVYPIGLLAMWGWMRTWPVWLKIVISSPCVISLLFIFFIVFVVGSVVRHNIVKARFEQQRIMQMQQQEEKVLQLTVTPTPTFTY